MKLPEAKEKFIQAWGTLGANWGINRTMAQIHALLLITPGTLSADNVMAQLNISRGNVNMNLRALIDWRLVKKQLKTGERKEFFIAEKDIWKVAVQIMKQRRNRELTPLMDTLQELQHIEDDTKNEEVEELQKMVQNITSFSNSADKTMDKMIKADEHWFFSIFMKMVK
jgi:DNA-binding transcriptional regulator GbsR (MarR family)